MWLYRHCSNCKYFRQKGAKKPRCKRIINHNGKLKQQKIPNYYHYCKYFITILNPYYIKCVTTWN